MLNFFRGIIDSITHARKLQAAFKLAEYLKTQNTDFKNWSYGEIVKHIMDEQNPVKLDKQPVNKERQVDLAKAA